MFCPYVQGAVCGLRERVGIHEMVYKGVGEKDLALHSLYDEPCNPSERSPLVRLLTQDEIAERAVDGWIGSPGHRENILTSTYDR